MKLLGLYFGLARIVPTILFIAIFLMSLYFGGGLSGFEALYGSAAIFFLWHFATTYNDFTDIEIDKISSPDRPLAREKMSDKIVMRIIIVDLAGIILFSVLLNILILSAFLFLTFLLFIYSHPKTRIKAKPYATITQGFVGAGCAFAGILLTTATARNISLMVFSFLLLSVFSVVKDFKDIEGDKKMGIKTLPVRFGATKALTILQLLVLAFFPVAYLLRLYLGLPAFTVPGAIFGIAALLLFQLYRKALFSARQLYNLGILILIPVLFFVSA